MLSRCSPPSGGARKPRIRGSFKFEDGAEASVHGPDTHIGGGELNPDDSTLIRPAKEHHLGRSDLV